MVFFSKGIIVPQQMLSVLYVYTGLIPEQIYFNLRLFRNTLAHKFAPSHQPRLTNFAWEAHMGQQSLLSLPFPHKVCIRKLNSRWTGSVMIGVTAQDPDSLTSLPSTANSIKISPWIVVNNAVYVNGNKVGKSRAHYLAYRKRASK